MEDPESGSNNNNNNGGMEEEELLQLLWKLKDPKKGVIVKDRKSLLKNYKQCFVGKSIFRLRFLNRYLIVRRSTRRLIERMNEYMID